MLQRARAGDPTAARRLVPLVYEELRSLARRELRHEPPGATLETASLVHEAYLRLIDQSRVDWKGRAHFLGIAAQMMRRVILDHAKRRRAVKRGRGWARLDLCEIASPVTGTRQVDSADLQGALEKLGALDPRQARIVEMRLIAMTEDQIAEVLGVARRTVQLDWAHAKAWLRRELSREHAHDPGPPPARQGALLGAARAAPD